VQKLQEFANYVLHNFLKKLHNSQISIAAAIAYRESVVREALSAG
jgi:chromosome segregation and condensation protein ScpB